MKWKILVTIVAWLTALLHCVSVATAFTAVIDPVRIELVDSYLDSFEVSHDCSDEKLCRSSFNSTTCRNVGICSTVVCTGRSDLPPAEYPLLDWEPATDNAGCKVEKRPPLIRPSTTFAQENNLTLQVDGSADGLAPCYSRRNSTPGDIFTVTFWIKATCTNCSVLELPQNGGPSIHIRVLNEEVCVNEAPNCLDSSNIRSSWTGITVRVIKDRMSLFVGTASLHLSNSSVNIVDIQNVFVGSGEIISMDDSFSLFDVRYYSDALSTREIIRSTTGLLDPSITEPQCRCPSSHPELDITNHDLCSDGQTTVPRFEEPFNGKNVIIDGDPVTKWASSEEGPVNITFTFKTVFQITSVALTFDESSEMGGDVMGYFIQDGVVETEPRSFICHQEECNLDLPPLDPKTVTVEEYEARKASGIHIVLKRSDPSVLKSFILAEVSVHGSCDCNGNAEKCVLDSDSYTCECLPDTKTQGPQCAACSPNFFREGDEFACAQSCDCNADGVVNVANSCNQTGGECLCKENVQGLKCDTCKSWTHSLKRDNPQGCTPCNCSRTGDVSCNVANGACTCKANTALPNCETCDEGFYGPDQNGECQACGCQIAGTEAQAATCNNVTGQCRCKVNVQGRTCATCNPGFYNLDTANLQGCTFCKCNVVGVDYCDPSSGQCVCRGGVSTDKTCTPVITSVDPMYGPMVGGTRVTIHGKLLGNATHNRTVFMGDVEQTIKNMNDSRIIFVTKQIAQLGMFNIKLEWENDTARDLGPANAFKYNPTPVLSIDTTKQYSTYISGGCVVEIRGSNLGSVKYPLLQIENKAEPAKNASEVCTHFGNMVVCWTPNIKSVLSNAEAGYAMQAIFDGVTSPKIDIQVSQDPSFESDKHIKFEYPFEKTITIGGQRLKSACLDNVYTVHIGVVQCSIQSVSATEIECKPPTVRPGDLKVHTLTVSIGNLEHIVGKLEYMDFYETTGFIIIVSSIAGIILITIILIIVCCCCRRKKRSADSPYQVGLDDKPLAADAKEPRPMNEYSDLSVAVNIPPTANGHNSSVEAETMIKEPKKGIVNSSAEETVLIEEFLPHVDAGLRDDVRRSYVGRNHFTLARSPLMKGPKTSLIDGSIQKNGSPILKLTVKSLLEPLAGTADSVFPTWANQALTECLRLKRQEHPNIWSIHGIGIEPQRFHILYPHVAQSSLKVYVADSSKELSMRQLLGLGQQVLEGLSFLVSKEITHKDIAARNCMVDANNTVKLGDAAFAWDLYKDEYVYDEQRERYLPLRWMAPESITDGFYDPSTDVWSFAVLVWELLTRGCLPFHEVTEPSQVRQFILDGYVLGKPEALSDDLYNILTNCWSMDSEARPTTSALSHSLSMILDDNDDLYANSQAIGSSFPHSPRRMKI